MGSPVRSNRGIEENTLAILDASGIRDSRDIHDDSKCLYPSVMFSLCLFYLFPSIHFVIIQVTSYLN